MENDVARQFQDTNDDDDSDGETVCFPSFLFATDGATVDMSSVIPFYQVQFVPFSVSLSETKMFVNSVLKHGEFQIIIQFLFTDYKKQRWVKVDERATLYSVLSRPDHVVSGIPGMVTSCWNLRH